MKLGFVCVVLFLIAYVATGMIAGPPQAGANHGTGGGALPSGSHAHNTTKGSPSDILDEENTFIRRLETSSPDKLADEYEAALGDNGKLYQIALRWAAADPEGLFAYLKSVHDPDRDSSAHYGAFQALVRIWAQKDPHKAMAALGDLPTRFHGTYAPVRELLFHIAVADPNVAATLAHAHPGIAFVQNPVGVENPEAIARAFAELAPSKFTTTGITSMAKLWAKKDPAAVAEWGKSLDWHLRQSVLASAGEALIDSDLAAARALFGAPEFSGHARGQLGRKIARKLAETDTEAAIRWANEHLSGEPRRDSISDVIKTMAKDDPREAIDLIENLPPDDVQRSAATVLAFSWFREDPHAALSWSESLDPNLREHTLNMMAGMWLRKDTEAALQYALEHEEAFDAISRKYYLEMKTEKDIRERLDWASKLSDEKRYHDGLEYLVRTWTYRNLQQASEYAAGLSGEVPRSIALRTVAQHYFYHSQKQAMEWAQGFTSEADRASILEGIRKAGIPAAEKQKLIDTFR